MKRQNLAGQSTNKVNTLDLVPQHRQSSKIAKIFGITAFLYNILLKQMVDSTMVAVTIAWYQYAILTCSCLGYP